MCQALDHEAAEIDLRNRPVQECDLNDAPLYGRGFVIAVDIIAANHIENNIGAGTAGYALNGINIIGGLIIDRVIRTQSLAGGAFFVRPGGGDDARAARLGNLDGSGADPGTAAVYQQSFAALQTTALKDIGPDGEKCFRQSGGLG